jgi:hypothetical protein
MKHRDNFIFMYTKIWCGIFWSVWKLRLLFSVVRHWIVDRWCHHAACMEQEAKFWCFCTRLQYVITEDSICNTIITGIIHLIFSNYCIKIYLYGEWFNIYILWNCNLKGIICGSDWIIILECTALIVSHGGLCCLRTCPTEFISFAVAFWIGSDAETVKFSFNKFLHHYSWSQQEISHTFSVFQRMSALCS